MAHDQKQITVVWSDMTNELLKWFLGLLKLPYIIPTLKTYILN